jgi:hypothetical protein
MFRQTDLAMVTPVQTVQSPGSVRIAGVQMVEQRAADFMRDFPYSSFILGISYISGSNDFRRVEFARLPIPDHMLNQKILDFSMWS